MSRLVLLLGVLFISFSLCAQEKEILDADIAFSNYSVKHGMKKAFLEFAHDEAVILRDKSMPIVGKAAIEESNKEMDDQLFTLSWKPLKAEMAASKDLGYTYGTYELKTGDVVKKGCYITVWKKTENGWKYVLDSGTEELE